MIISKTPLRISFSGGGSDISSFYRKYTGAVISASIDKFIYVNVNKKFDSGIRVAYSKNEEVSNVCDIEHPIVRQVMQYIGLQGGVEITTIADIPSLGTGLGSSSSFTVGLLHALNAYQGYHISKEKLAADSCHVEIDLCGEPIGKQDQYASSFGGLNLIEFDYDGSVIVSPIICKPDTIKEIKRSLLVFYTGIKRSASTLLKKQLYIVNNDRKKQDTLQQMVKLTYTLRDEIHKNNIDVFGKILHENWMLKKSLTDSISTNEIDQWYSKARSAGALGGKILGAGGGGFLMLFAPPDAHTSIKNTLSTLQHMPVDFDSSGSQIIFHQ